MDNAIVLVGRILLGHMFLISGIGKIPGFAGTAGYIASAGLPFPEVVAALTVALEIGGGLALILGWKTAVAAWALAIFSVAAGLLFHFDLADRMQIIQLQKNLTIAGGMLLLAVHGAGAYSLDARRR
jgi:putative oxidoreductase